MRVSYRLALAGLFLGAALLAPPAVRAGQPVPTPAPSGTPVTFGGVPNSKPLPTAPGAPDDVKPPVTNPYGTPATSFVEKHETFVVGDYLISPRVYNEFSPGTRSGKTSYQIRGATEFNIGVLPVMLEGESRNQAYGHDSGPTEPVACNGISANDPSCVRRIGSSNTSDSVPAFTVRDYDIDGRVGIKLLDPRIYLSAAYLFRSNNAGYGIESGYGAGLEKLPDFEGPLGVYFGLYYFPNVTGRYTGLNNAVSEGLRYRIFRYEGGFTVTPKHSPLFLDLGIEGDRETAGGGSPTNETHIEPYAGVGLRPSTK